MTAITSPPHPTHSAEFSLVRDVSAWLASQTMPDDALVWCPNWETMTVVDNVGSLRMLVSDLPTGEYAGLKRNGSTGPWAQVMAFEYRADGAGGWPFELHPHNWSLGVPAGVWKLISDDTLDVAGHLWNWVAAGTPPAEQLAPTTYPRAGQGYW